MIPIAQQQTINQQSLGTVSTRRFDYLDSLRGLAAMAVVLSHVKQAYALPKTFAYFDRTPLGLFWDGSASVKLFFVLSGFVLSYNYFKNSNGMVGFSYPNYIIKLIAGKLYINPYNTGTRKVQPILRCVERVTNGPLGLGYLAHFSYENRNATPYYVPIGADNNIVASGPYSGTQPIVFLPGTGNFDIYFDGKRLRWTLTTNDGTLKTSIAAEASSTSNKCDARITSITMENVVPGEILVEEKTMIYPNPVRDKLTLTSTRPITSEKNVTILDVAGRPIRIKGLRRVSTNVIEMDASAVRKGVYFLRVQTKNGFESFRFVKL
jgi:hypothetical protein